MVFECFTHKLIVLAEGQYHIDDSSLSHFALHKLMVTVNLHDLLYVNSSIAGTSNYWLCINYIIIQQNNKNPTL